MHRPTSPAHRRVIVKPTPYSLKLIKRIRQTQDHRPRCRSKPSLLVSLARYFVQHSTKSSLLVSPLRYFVQHSKRPAAKAMNPRLPSKIRKNTKSGTWTISRLFLFFFPFLWVHPPFFGAKPPTKTPP